MSWGNVLEFNTAGYPVRLNGVEVQSLPSIQGAADSYLHNDGQGNWSWQTITATGTGDFVGPAGATNNNLIKFGDATGKLGADSGILTADAASAVSLKHAAVTLDADAQTLLNLSTQAVGIPTKAANLVWASPVSGGAAVPTWRKVIEADFAFTNITTANAVTGVHGLCPALSNDPTQYLNGQGNFAAVSSGAAAGYIEQAFDTATPATLTVTHNLNGYPVVQILDAAGKYVELPYSIKHNSKNDFTIAFTGAQTGTIVASLGSPGVPGVTTQVVDYTATANDRYIIIQASKIVTLPAAAGIIGREYVVKRDYTLGDVTVKGTGADTIDGDATLIMAANHSAARLIAISTGWMLV